MIRFPMLYHIVFWNFKDQYKVDYLEAIDLLETMRGKIPFLLDLQAGTDVVHSARSWDLALIVKLEDQDALKAYDSHPAHLPVKEWIAQRVEKAASVDFEGL